MTRDKTSAPRSRTERYQQRIHDALDAALARAALIEGELSTARLVVLSDQHRGARNRADDFQRAERAYNAALAWYNRLGYTLVMAGDVEELWQEAPEAILAAYPRSLDLEATFHRANRLYRLWGNHDDEWHFEDAVRRHLQPLYGNPPLSVHESLLVTLTDKGQQVGSLLVLHGHQGTRLSDRWARYSRVIVRYLWRPLQRLAGVALNTPARDWRLREKHELAMYAWAAERPNLVLIAGHTHRPVFESRSPTEQLEEALCAAEAELATAGDDAPLLERVAGLRADLEWVRVLENQRAQLVAAGDSIKPCYFNTGCCCFVDGHITGLEIAEGEIRLVRWPDKEGQPRPQVLEQESLEDVLKRC